MGMEDETRAFLIRIVNTVAMVLLWMMTNVFAGIYEEWAFFSNKPDWINIGYYAYFLITLVMLIRYLKKKWEL